MILIILIISWFAFPAWREIPGGWLILLGTVTLSVLVAVRNFVSIIKELNEIQKQSDHPVRNSAQILTDEIEQNGEVNIVAQELHAEQIGGHRTTIGQYHIHVPPPKVEIILPALPVTGEIPDPAPLPYGSRMVHTRNAVFAGRTHDLLALANSLVFPEEPNRVFISQVAVATGMGGIGKTQLAVEFCYRYGRYFEAVHWISAFSSDIGNEIAECGRVMSFPNWPETLSEQVDFTLFEWAKSRRRLLVLDNLEEPELLRDWLPRLNHCRILITSRRPDWPAEFGLDELHLGLLDLNDSLTLIRKLAVRLNEIPDTELELIIDRLGYLPLAIDLAGRYLNDCNQLSPEKFLAEIDMEETILDHRAMHEWVEGSPTRHETSLMATFTLSWKQLEGDSIINSLARKNFQLAGWCAPNTLIPIQLLEGVVDAEGEGNFSLAIKRLYESGLLEKSNDGPLIHPLLAVFSKGTCDNNITSTLGPLVDNLNSLTAKAIQSGIPRNFLPLITHVKFLCPIAEEYKVNNAAALWDNLGAHYRMVANLESARSCHLKSLELIETTYGPSHPEVVFVLNNLGLVLKEQGDLAGARSCIERAIKIAESAYDPEETVVSMLMNNVGRDLQDQGDLVGALPKIEHALKIAETNYGPNHPEVALIVNNLGRILQDQGDLVGAQPYIERALNIAETAYGPNHPMVAIFLNNLGGLFTDQRKLEKALHCFERALKIDEAVFGLTHPNIAISIHNIGIVLGGQENYSKARACFEQALTIDEDAFGPEHPKVAKDLHSLGGILFIEGDLSAACDLVDRACKIALNVYGPEHPTTQRYRKSLNIMEKMLLNHLTRPTHS